MKYYYIFLLFFIYSPLFCLQLNHNISLNLTTNGGTGYSKNTIEPNASYNLNTRFWKTSAGIQQSYKNTQVTVSTGVFYKNTFLIIGLDGIYHLGFWNNFALENDLYTKAHLSLFIFSKIITLNAECGFGVKFTSFYNVPISIPPMRDLNGFYSFSAGIFPTKNFTLLLGIKTYDFFVYNLGFMPQLFLETQSTITQQTKIIVGVTQKYTDNANDNISVDFVSAHLGVLYRFKTQ